MCQVPKERVILIAALSRAIPVVSPGRLVRSIESFWGWPNNKALSKLIKCLSAERKGSLGLDIGFFFKRPFTSPALRLYQSRLRQRLKCAILWGVAQALRLPILLFDMHKQRQQRQSPNNHRPSQQVCLFVCLSPCPSVSHD